MKMNLASVLFLVLLSSSALAVEDATKNHRLEKRQDDSLMFFGGWRPLKHSASSSFYTTSESGRYHDLISALPGSLDAVSRYYTHALPSTYHKDIYSYYPRPAIKSKPKKNTPVYMERLKPRRQQQKQAARGYGTRGGGGGGGGGSPQFIDIQKLDLNHIQGLQDLLLQAKELPLSQLNIPNKGKQFDFVEVALQTLPHENYNPRSRNTNRYNRNKRPQINKSIYGRVPQSYIPAQLPLQYQYIEVPKHKTAIPQIHPKEVSISPVQLPHHIPAVDDILGIKDIQVIEVPVPAGIPHPVSSSKSSRSSQYGSKNTAHIQAQYRATSHKPAPKVSFPANTYYAHQSKQPRKHYSPPQPVKSGYNQQQQHQQAEIEAELVKLSESDIQGLLKNLEIVQKNSHDFLKILPLAQTPHTAQKEQVHLVLSLPGGNHGEQNGKPSGYDSKDYGASQQRGKYKSEEQYIVIPQGESYSPYSSGKNLGGYQIEKENQAHNGAGYQVVEQSGGNVYEQGYQNGEEQPNYAQAVYQQDVKNDGYSEGQQDYQNSGYDPPSQQQEQYLEIISPQSEDGYKREPVLAVEIHKGQTIEDVIKAIDPETLQRLGAHGKEGLEIEVVEVPIQEYSAESKKSETYVSSANSTTKAPAKKAVTSTTTVSQEKLTTTTVVKKPKS